MEDRPEHSLDGQAPGAFELQRDQLWREWMDELLKPEPVEVQMVFSWMKEAA